MGPRDHTYINLGSYWLYGRAVQRLSGETLEGVPTVLSARQPFYRVGGNFTFNYRCCLQFNGLYMYGHDYNLLPVDSTGALLRFQLPTTARSRLCMDPHLHLAVALPTWNGWHIPGCTSCFAMTALIPIPITGTH